jgi:hypothetical protein
MQSIRSTFSGVEFTNKAAGFEGPTQLRGEAQRRQWQSINKTWWEATPMRYDWREALTAPVGTKACFEEIDSQFLARKTFSKSAPASEHTLNPSLLTANHLPESTLPRQRQL